MVPLVLLDDGNRQQGIFEQSSYPRWRGMLGRVLSNKEAANNYWSASPYANNSNNAWQLNFNNGNDNANNRNNNKRVRLVRTGAWYGCFI